MNISITGDLGSGKSTISQELVKRGYSYVSMGTILRDYARSHNISILEANRQASIDSTIDEYIDTKQIELGKKRTKAVFDSRLGWYFVPNSFKVYVTVDPLIAARRIMNAKRDVETYKDIQSALADIYSRRDLERKRFQIKYGVDYFDTKNYNLIIDSTMASPKTIALEIIKLARLYSEGKATSAHPEYILLSPNRLYPTQSRRDLNSKRLSDYYKEFKTDKSVVNEQAGIAVGINSKNQFCVIDGHHRLLASLQLHKELVTCSGVEPYEFEINPTWCYDFEDIGGFKYIEWNK